MNSSKHAAPRSPVAPGEEWKDANTIAARRKWKRKLDLFFRPATRIILEAAQVRPGLEVLDTASGMGEPAVELAAAVAPTGHVTATDFEPNVLEVAAAEARSRGLSNLTTRQADAQALPFADQSFDRVTCRFGIMFFPDSGKALREALRVLKAGGRAVYVAWTAPHQPIYKTTTGILTKYVHEPPPDPDAPHPLRFAEPGSLRRAMEEAGFAQVEEQARAITLIWPGPPAEYWQRFAETAVAFRSLIDGVPAEKREAVFGEIVAAISEYYDGRQITFPGTIVVATGIRE